MSSTLMKLQAQPAKQPIGGGHSSFAVDKGVQLTKSLSRVETRASWSFLFHSGQIHPFIYFTSDARDCIWVTADWFPCNTVFMFITVGVLLRTQLFTMISLRKIKIKTIMNLHKQFKFQVPTIGSDFVQHSHNFYRQKVKAMFEITFGFSDWF